MPPKKKGPMDPAAEAEAAWIQKAAQWERERIHLTEASKEAEALDTKLADKRQSLEEDYAATEHRVEVLVERDRTSMIDFMHEKQRLADGAAHDQQRQKEQVQLRGELQESIHFYTRELAALEKKNEELRQSKSYQEEAAAQRRHDEMKSQVAHARMHMTHLEEEARQEKQLDLLVSSASLFHLSNLAQQQPDRMRRRGVVVLNPDPAPGSEISKPQLLGEDNDDEEDKDQILNRVTLNSMLTYLVSMCGLGKRNQYLSLYCGRRGPTGSSADLANATSDWVGAHCSGDRGLGGPSHPWARINPLAIPQNQSRLYDELESLLFPQILPGRGDGGGHQGLAMSTTQPGEGPPSKSLAVIYLSGHFAEFGNKNDVTIYRNPPPANEGGEEEGEGVAATPEAMTIKVTDLMNLSQELCEASGSNVFPLIALDVEGRSTAPECYRHDPSKDANKLDLHCVIYAGRVIAFDSNTKSASTNEDQQPTTSWSPMLRLVSVALRFLDDASWLAVKAEDDEEHSQVTPTWPGSRLLQVLPDIGSLHGWNSVPIDVPTTFRSKAVPARVLLKPLEEARIPDIFAASVPPSSYDALSAGTDVGASLNPMEWAEGLDLQSAKFTAIATTSTPALNSVSFVASGASTPNETSVQPPTVVSEGTLHWMASLCQSAASEYVKLHSDQDAERLISINPTGLAASTSVVRAPASILPLLYGIVGTSRGTDMQLLRPYPSLGHLLRSIEPHMDKAARAGQHADGGAEQNQPLFPNHILRGPQFLITIVSFEGRSVPTLEQQKNLPIFPNSTPSMNDASLGSLTGLGDSPVPFRLPQFNHVHLTEPTTFPAILEKEGVSAQARSCHPVFASRDTTIHYPCVIASVVAPGLDCSQSRFRPLVLTRRREDSDSKTGLAVFRPEAISELYRVYTKEVLSTGQSSTPSQKLGYESLPTCMVYL